MGKITPIRAIRYNNLNMDNLPKTNPFFVENWELRHKNECREIVLEKYREICRFLYWVGYQSGTTSSSGYSSFNGGFTIDNLRINQELIYVHSMIPAPGTWNLIGFKYGISFIEWVQDQGIINSGSIDDINEFGNKIITFNKMLNGDESDKNIAIKLMHNNINGICEI